MDLCALSETKKKRKENIKYEDYVLLYSGVEKNARAMAGVRILIHERFENIIDKVKYTNKKIIQVLLKTNNERTHFISLRLRHK